MAEALEADGHSVISYDLKDGKSVSRPNLEGVTELDVLINNAGINIIGHLEDFEPTDWDRIMDTNARGIFLMAKACLPLLARSKGTILNIVSNASHMPMTGSLAYNASKGAAHIMTKQLARELTKRHGITVFGISPNKLAGTEMSDSIDRQVVETRGWTMEQARKYQLSALLAGEETNPSAVAGLVAYLLKTKYNHKYLTGCVIPYGA
jgi:NAD(P)-dependent dehydrogenase (short-subunit alcohol dehydrogenase family)